MSEQKSWSQRSLEEAAQRKRDYEHSARTGVAGLGSASHRGAEEHRARQREREFNQRMIADASRSSPVSGRQGNAQTSGAESRPSPLSIGQKIQAWIEFMPHRIPAWLYWVAGLLIAVGGYGYGIESGQTPGAAATSGLLIVVVVAIAARLALWLIGVAVVVAEFAIKVGLFIAALYLALQWLQSSGAI